MKKKYIPQPRSNFLKISCECGNVQEIFSHATTHINCRVCGKVLAEPRSGITRLFGEVIEILDNK
ncbi:30S ribosomal protein S27e [Candidatus Heimdallarchaeota archaeon B3_Heim]|nr:MAG: 30S ribosomal protein S27e [Candidatus Heimdallarchaeota archaeon B3_Heim]